MSVLSAGGGFGIYPEGTRSRDGRLARGKTGVAWLALTADCPVVPVAVAGTDRVQPVGASWPRPRRVLGHVRAAADLPRVPGQGGQRQGPARGDRRDHGGDRRALRPGEGRLVSGSARAEPSVESRPDVVRPGRRPTAVGRHVGVADDAADPVPHADREADGHARATELLGLGVHRRRCRPSGPTTSSRACSP